LYNPSLLIVGRMFEVAVWLPPHISTIVASAIAAALLGAEVYESFFCPFLHINAANFNVAAAGLRWPR
jgi:hypothetical protein